MTQSSLLKNTSAFALGTEMNEFFNILPPDILHTVHAGLIRYVVCWTLSIIKVSNKNT